jgi:hypothetical protein
MIATKTKYNLFFKWMSVLFLLPLIYHITAVILKIDASPIWRHLLFISINIFCIIALKKRSIYFVIFFTLLTLQQFYSHGTYFLKLWKEQHQIHWLSIAVFIVMPITLFFLIKEKLECKQKKS